MSDFQKNIISRLLKEHGKTKRELADYLDIHENGINRLIGNTKLNMERLEQIAHFLDMNIKVLFDKIYPQQESLTKIAPRVKDREYSNTEEIILLLSEIVTGQKNVKEIEDANAQKLQEVLSLILSASNLQLDVN